MNKSNNNQLSASPSGPQAPRRQRKARPPRRAQNQRRPVQGPQQPSSWLAVPQAPRLRREPRSNPSQDQIGAVVRTRLTKVGLSDIRRHRIAWVMGYTFVGNGTNGQANAVYFQTASTTWIVKPRGGTTSSGQVPILSSDTDLGQTYVKDVEKHYARKVIRRMWIHVDSLQPSTSNNMMCVIGVSRGPGGAPYSIPLALATNTSAGNAIGDVSSMKDAFTVDSWEHRTVEITDKIAGGSGPLQNEFEISATQGADTNFYVTTNTASLQDVEGVAPACIAVAGNNTTAGLQNTAVHQITIEQEVDLLDYVGGMSQPNAED